MICLETNPTTGDLRIMNPQPTDLSGCSLIGSSYSELSADVWQLTPAQGAEIGLSIMLVWAVAFGFRMVARTISEVDSERENT